MDSVSPIDWDAVAADLAPIECLADRASLRAKSRDFFWYSPVLNEKLKGVSAELVVCPANEAELIRTLAPEAVAVERVFFQTNVRMSSASSSASWANRCGSGWSAGVRRTPAASACSAPARPRTTRPQPQRDNPGSIPSTRANTGSDPSDPVRPRRGCPTVRSALAGAE